MTIRGLRILPPFAIARLGSASEPLDNYTIGHDTKNPLNFRRILPAETLIVDERTGEIVEKDIPDEVTFKDGKRIRPVAPFLEVFAINDAGALEPLTRRLLAKHRLKPSDVKWKVTVANRKVVRRTDDQDDLVEAHTGWFSGHGPRVLKGTCNNFISKKRFIDFGRVRYIRPNDDFPEIRLRFTPATGLIYGPNTVKPDPVIPRARAIYRRDKSWVKFEIADDGNDTLPPALYAIEPPAPMWLNNNIAVSRGYLDDACDGIVEVKLALRDGTLHTAMARVSSGPPTLVPDALFVRNLADDFDQVIFGPEIPDDEPHEVTRKRAEEIVRRAYETVRFMNVAVMNGNPFDGRNSLLLDSMPEEEAADTERAIRPIMSQPTVDTLAVLALHQEAFAALRGGTAPWFVRILRRPESVTDYTDHGRRKMPALMCGADNSYLALTHRQINTITRAATFATAPDSPDARNAGAKADAESRGERPPGRLTPRNLSAQVHYVAAGNPVNSRPLAAISNCCPGLEVDFRAVWRRMFEGIVLREYDNLVVDIDPKVTDPAVKALKGHRLLGVEIEHKHAGKGKDRKEEVLFTAEMWGPAPSDVEGRVLLTTNQNPYGLGPLEWSNALAKVLRGYTGKRVPCHFTMDVSPDHQPFVKTPPNFLTVELKVRDFFEPESAVISRALAEPGELTQGLCSPWQNDYRECSCYYWASARPDYVNLEPSPSGLSSGDNWLQKERTGKYVPDDYVDERLILYDDLFLDWEKWLKVQIGGRDVPDTEP
jgi:hypothetical protein